MHLYLLFKRIVFNSFKVCKGIYLSVVWGLLDIYSYLTRDLTERKLGILSKLFVGSYLGNWTEAYTRLLMYKLDKENSLLSRQEELAVVLIYLAEYDREVDAEELLSKNNVVTLLVRVLVDSLAECKEKGSPTSRLHKDVRKTVTATIDKIIKENYPNSLSLARHKDYYVEKVTLVLNRAVNVTDTPLKRAYCKRLWMYLN